MKQQRKKLGLVLGAGAARGFAHIGVIQSFLEHGLPIDALTGTSMGALLGGVYATGTDINYIADFSQNVAVSRFLDFSLKDGGIVRGRKVEALMRVLTGNKSIEQLPIPFACAAINVQTGQVEVFKCGGLYEAIRASISMPGIFAPYTIGDACYIDGGTLARMPIAAAKELGADVTVAVDVSWRGQTLPLPKNSIGVLQNALSIAAWYVSSRQEKQADVLLTPDVFATNPFSAKECAFCIAQGRAAADAKIEEIRALLEA